MAEAAPLFVCRPEDVAALRAHLDSARAGTSRTVQLVAPFGGGKRAAVGELIRGLPADEDVLAIRVSLSDEEDGLRTLLRIYAAIYGTLYRDQTLRGKVELLLNAQLPQHTRRVQGWIQAFIEGLKKVPAEGEQSFQVTLPRDNPLTGLVEILSAISRKMLTVLELQNVHHSHSVVTAQIIEALHDARKQGRLLIILGTEPVDEAARGWMPAPLLDLLTRRGDEMPQVVLAPWGEAEVRAYGASKGLAIAAPGRVAELAEGRPAYVAEVVDRLGELDKLGDALEGLGLADIVPLEPDAGELDEPEPAREGQRRKAGAADADRILFLCALLGLSFPSGLVADMDAWDRDSVDDLLDACPDLVKELQFSNGLGTWIYQFKRGIYRKAVLDRHVSDEDHRIAVNVGAFLERFLVPRGYEFLVKTLRIYADHGAGQRANLLRNVALSTERPEVWAMANDHLKHFESVPWSEPMRRAVYLNLLEAMVNNAEVEAAEKLVQEVMAWASERQDRAMEARTLYAGSRLDMRRGDLYRARDRARDALKIYTAAEDKLMMAEIENHLAGIEFNDGNVNACLDHVRIALETARVPQVEARADHLRGLVARRAGKWVEAAEHFRKANEVAGNAGIAFLALEAGYLYGEALLQSQQLTKAADVLARVAQIAQSLQNKPMERQAAALLGRTQGALKNYEAALQMANRCLQLTQELKYERLIPMDVHNVAYFQLMLGRATEANSLFAKARERAPADDIAFLRELYFYSGVAAARIGEKGQAADFFGTAIKHATATKDWRKVMQANENLAAFEAEKGDKSAAQKLLQAAIAAAEAGDLREERKGLRRKLEEL